MDDSGSGCQAFALDRPACVANQHFRYTDALQISVHLQSQMQLHGGGNNDENVAACVKSC